MTRVATPSRTPVQPTARRPAPAKNDLLLNRQQLDLKRQGRIRRHRRARTPITVSRSRRAGQRRLAANLDLLHALGPARHHAVKREARRAAALVGAVELLAVGQRAFVMHFHRVSGLRIGTRAVGGVDDLDAGGQGFGGGCGEG